MRVPISRIALPRIGPAEHARERPVYQVLVSADTPHTDRVANCVRRSEIGASASSKLTERHAPTVRRTLQVTLLAFQYFADCELDILSRTACVRSRALIFTTQGAQVKRAESEAEISLIIG